jgi:hypothetical protein
LKEFHRMTGIVLFQKLEWNEAVGYLSIGGVDPREIISFFPDLVPPSLKNTYTAPHTHTIEAMGTTYRSATTTNLCFSPTD